MNLWNPKQAAKNNGPPTVHVPCGWKETLPVSKDVPCQLERLPSSQQDTCTFRLEENLSSQRVTSLLTGRNPFQPVPCLPFKGRVSKDTRQRLQMALSPEKAAGYPDVLGPSLALEPYRQLAVGAAV
jgi:hypothetical protein